MHHGGALTVTLKQRQALYHGECARLATVPPAESGANSSTVPTPSPMLRSQQHCGHGSLIGASPDRGHVVVVPMMCKSWDCPRCGPRKRAAWINTLISGEPNREITLTCPVGKFPSPTSAARHMKKAWTKFVKVIRARYGDFQYAIVWELTKKDIPHMHILVRGAYIPNSFISKLWSRLGIGYITFIRAITSGKARATHACKYIAKSFGQSAKALRPLRIIQLSRGYTHTTPDTDQVKRFPDYSWAWSSRDPDEVTEEFLRSPRYHDVEHHADGSSHVYLSPAPLDVRDEQYRKLLTAWPELDFLPLTARLKDESPSTVHTLTIGAPEKWPTCPSLHKPSSSAPVSTSAPSATSAQSAPASQLTFL